MLSVVLPYRGEILFTFDHKAWEQPISIGGHHKAKARTTCTMRIGPVIFAQAAYCGPQDNFSKEAGRKIALTRALKMSGLSKLERKAVWERYFNRNVKNKDYPVQLSR